MPRKVDPLNLPHPDFVLGQILDPDEFDANNREIKLKINEIAEFVTNDATIIDATNTLSATAITTSNQAVTTANGAVATANNAMTTASNAVGTANSAVTTANQAVTTAGNAVTTASTATSTASSAVDTANGAVTVANQTKSDYLANNIIIDQKIGVIDNKVDQSIVTINGAVATVALKVDKSYVDQLAVNFTLGAIPNGSLVETKLDTTLVSKINGKSDTTYVDTQLGLKSNLDSPTFTGNPTAPTPADNDDDTSIATTAYVKRESNKKANLNGGNTLTGNQTVTDGLFNHKSTTAQANKREYSWKVEFAGYVLNALDDAGNLVRNLFQVFHDGGVRIVGKLSADSGIEMLNNQAIRGKRTDGSTKALAYVGNDELVHLGDATSGTVIDGTGDIKHGANVILEKKHAEFQSARDFPNGTLIYTDLSFVGGLVWSLEIQGDTYQERQLVDTMVQGYIDNDLAVVQTATLHKGMVLSGLRAGNIGGKLCFWFSNLGYYHGFRVNAYYTANTSPIPINYVTNIVNSGLPVWTNEVVFPVVRGSKDTGWKTVTINVGDWGANTALVGCNFSAVINDTSCAQGDIVDVEIGYSPYFASYNVAFNAGVSSYVYAGTGAFSLFSASIPSQAFEIKYRINK